MAMMKTFCSFMLVLTMSMFIVAAIQAENCEVIRFKRGANNHTVQGMILPDDVICYEVTARAGQLADITITGNNVMFSIEGVVDAQDKFSFITDDKTYKILVGQLMQSVANQPFVLMVSIK